MPKRDWARDWELCQKAKEKAAEIIQNPTLLIEIPAEYRLGVWLHHLRFPDEALEGWPVALEERARLEQRVRELEEENRCLKAVAEAAQEYIAVACDPNQPDWYESVVFGKLRKALAKLEEAKE